MAVKPETLGHFIVPEVWMVLSSLFCVLLQQEDLFKLTLFEDVYVQFSSVALNLICRTRNKDATTQRSWRCWVMSLVTGSLVILSRILLSVRFGIFYFITLANVTFEK